MNNELFVLLYFIEGQLDDSPDAVSDDVDKLKTFAVEVMNGGKELEWEDSGNGSFTSTFELDGNECCYRIERIKFI